MSKGMSEVKNTAREKSATQESSVIPLLDRLHAHLDTLGLSEASVLLEAHLERAAREESSYAQMLLDLLQCEVLARHDRQFATRTKLAHLPFRKTLEEFDFSFQPSIEERQIRELKTLRFVSDASNVLFLGPPGVGKTHLSVGLAIEALRGGMSVYFITAHDLITDLSRAAAEGKLQKRMQVYTRPRVLVIDEMGYLPLSERGATLFFQMVSARYERGSILLSSNKSYGEWGNVFGDPVIATAILDRLLHHSSTVNIRGESYRLKERRKAGVLSHAGVSSPSGVSSGVHSTLVSSSQAAQQQASQQQASQQQASQQQAAQPFRDGPDA